MTPNIHYEQRSTVVLGVGARSVVEGLDFIIM